MTIKVYGRELVSSLNALGAYKQAVNLSVTASILTIQAYEPIIVDETVRVLEVTSTDAYSELSVELDNSYNIIRDDETVLLTITDQFAMLETDSMQCKYKAVTIQRMDIKEMDTAQTYTNISCDSFEKIARAEAAIVSVSKLLRVGEPAVVVSNRKAYIVLSNFAYIVDTDLPDCVLSMKVIHAINDVVKRSRVSSVNIEVESNNGSYCIVPLGSGRFMAFTYKRDNSVLPQTISAILDSCKKYSTVSLDMVSDGIKILQKTYKQIEADLVIDKNNVLVSVKKDVRSIINVGKLGDGDRVYVKTNIITLSALLRIMGANAIEVLTEGRFLCCRNSNGTVLISGVY